MDLTKPQIEALKDAARESGVYANASYKPTQKLEELGLVEAYPLKFGRVKFHITEAGAAALAKIQQ